MGIAFSHCEASWAYSGFMSFREKLVETIIVPCDLREMYKSGKHFILKEHPIFDFINHSDCDGFLSPEQLKVIVPALEEILEKWDITDVFISHDYNNGKELIKGMKAAIEANENLKF